MSKPEFPGNYILKFRNERGSGILILTFGVIALLCAFLALGLKFGWFELVSHKDITAAEAASVAAAKELSRVVINDPYYGYIALTDYPPVGKATKAGDDEPMPVTGINTIIGTARLQWIIANQLENSELKQLAKADIAMARSASKSIFEALKKTVDPHSVYIAHDMDGNIVKPYDTARQVYLKSLPQQQQDSLKDLTISIGWLKNGSTTNTPVPRPNPLSEVPSNANINGEYRAFMDIPAHGESFYFAGISNRPSLVNIDDFMAPDGKRLCSAVKVAITVKNSIDATHFVSYAACALPYGAYDVTPPGVLSLGFSDGFVPTLKNMNDLLFDQQLNKHQTDLLVASGDYPDDKGSTLTHRDASNTKRTIAQLFALGLHDWLRTAHCKPRVDSIISTMQRPFKSPADDMKTGAQQTFYEFDREGNIVVTRPEQTPFMSQTVLDGQVYALTFDALENAGCQWALSFRDEVNNLSVMPGGKHGGQSLPGNPVNWCELPAYGGSPAIAALKGKGSEYLRLAILGDNNDYGPDGAISLNAATFVDKQQHKAIIQPRKNYYSGGLAVEFQINSPLPIDPNHAPGNNNNN